MAAFFLSDGMYLCLAVAVKNDEKRLDKSGKGVYNVGRRGISQLAAGGDTWEWRSSWGKSQ